MTQVTVTIRKAVGPVDARAGQAFTKVLAGATDRELVNAPDEEVLGQRLILALREKGFLILPSDWLEAAVGRRVGTLALTPCPLGDRYPGSDSWEDY